ncbi:MAG: hypothetical protein IKL79_01125 [Clostridia bacterium]|nr:hypothetical protein [Clostridia bacterium]
MASIRTALIALGVKGRATAVEVTLGRYYVTVNGEYVGIWDVDKNTFID